MVGFIVNTTIPEEHLDAFNSRWKASGKRSDYVRDLILRDLNLQPNAPASDKESYQKALSFMNELVTISETHKKQVIESDTKLKETIKEIVFLMKEILEPATKEVINNNGSREQQC